jgi:hypothetical protein
MLCLVTCNLRLTCVGMLEGGGGVISRFLSCRSHILLYGIKSGCYFLAFLTVILDYHGSLGVLEL